MYAEDPARDFRPSAGVVTEARWPRRSARRHVGAHRHRGQPVLRPTARQARGARGRPRAARSMRCATRSTRRAIAGIETNCGLHPVVRRVADLRRRRGRRPKRSPRTGTSPRTIEVLDAGSFTTVQAIPAASGSGTSACRRAGRWTTGRSRSGTRSSATRPTRAGPRVHRDRPDPARRHRRSSFCLTGAHMSATLDGRTGAVVRAVRRAAPGATLRLGAVDGPGLRTYVLVRGGFDVPAYLGSAATFTLGGFGGHGGRALQTGDVLHLAPDRSRADAPNASRRCDGATGAHARVGARRRRRSARRARLLHRATTRHVLRHRLERPLQLVAHGRPAGGPEPGVGPARRR